MPEPKICQIQNCGNVVLARGWCANHYQRWRKYGTPTGGKDGPRRGESRRYLEEVVLPYEGDECLIWPFKKSDYKYAYVHVDGKMALVSREVCRRLYGPAPSPEHEAAHSCRGGAAGCVTPRHLRWATAVENAADKIAHGTKLLGSQLVYAKFTEEQVLEIASLRGHERQISIARRFNVTSGAIHAIWHGRTWGWLTGL